MRQTATTKEQSNRLLACGIDPRSADMSFVEFPHGQISYYVGNVTINTDSVVVDGKVVSKNESFAGQPAWSLSALLELLPYEIAYIDDKRYMLRLVKLGKSYEIRYYSPTDRDPFGIICETPIECAVQTLEWLLRHRDEIKRIL